MTPLEFDSFYKGAINTYENKEQQQWERMRLQTWFLINVQLERKKQIKKPEKLIKFPWEKIDIPKFTHEQKEEIKRKWEHLK